MGHLAGLADPTRLPRGLERWTLPGASQTNGYPLVKFQGRQWLVHRLAYDLLIGPLEQGQQLDQACAQSGCMRPGPGYWELRAPRRDQGLDPLPGVIRYESTTSTASMSGPCRCTGSAAFPSGRGVWLAFGDGRMPRWVLPTRPGESSCSSC
jgi:hypothetical protein